MTEEWNPHVILMDVVIPVMDGHEAIRRIRQSPCGAKTAILAVTADAFDTDREAALYVGADGFLTKPIAADILFAAIPTHLGVMYRYEEDRSA